MTLVHPVYELKIHTGSLGYIYMDWTSSFVDVHFSPWIYHSVCDRCEKDAGKQCRAGLGKVGYFLLLTYATRRSPPPTTAHPPISSTVSSSHGEFPSIYTQSLFVEWLPHFWNFQELVPDHGSVHGGMAGLTHFESQSNLEVCHFRIGQAQWCVRSF